MFEESVPNVEQEQGREAGESGNEVTFEGANVFFWPGLSGGHRGDKLEADVFFPEEALERGRVFVVTDLKFGCKSAGFQVVV